MLNLSVYFIVGLVIAIWLYLKPNRYMLLIQLAYWLVILLWALQLINPFSLATWVWLQPLGISFSYHIDGLSRLMTMLISGIGLCIFAYGYYYNPKKRAKLLSLLQFFALSMLLLVLSDNLVIVFLAWELTTISSYFLIQFNTTSPKANQAAFNAMLVSVFGALLMLAGFILLQLHGHSFSISHLIFGEQLSQATLKWVFILLLIGAITKSAQWPFHFWLPGAMQAPTPVSGYLHSATMVNAGIYLLARFHPLLANLTWWYPTLTTIGLLTVITASFRALFQTDLKAILAYTTLFALGTMVILLASQQWLPAEVFAAFMLFHALYKAAAFMWVGYVDKTTATRDIDELSGFARGGILSALVFIIGFAAMAGLPPFYGFTIKGLLYESKLVGGDVSYTLMALNIITSLLLAAVSIKCLWLLLGKNKAQTKQAYNHKAYRHLLYFPTILVLVIVMLSIDPALTNHLQQAVASSVMGPFINNLSVLSGYGWYISIFTVIAGLVVMFLIRTIHSKPYPWAKSNYAEKIFLQVLNTILAFGQWFTLKTQGQPLQQQLNIIFGVIAGFLVLSLIMMKSAIWPGYWLPGRFSIDAVSVLLMLASCSLLLSHRFLVNLITFSVIGLLLSAVFILSGAPDVAFTQLMVEILTVITLVIALRKTKMNIDKVDHHRRWFHALIAISLGVVLYILLSTISHHPLNMHISDYYLQNSLSKAHGKNVVNVILVDFRAFDTFGEVLVLLGAAIAIWLLIDNKAKPKEQD